MSKFKIALVALVSILSFQLHAQDDVARNLRQHIPHLKNGRSIIGIVIDYGKGRPAVIELMDGERIEIPESTIESIAPINQRRKKPRINKSKISEYAFVENGWNYYSSLGFISRGSSIRADGLGLSIETGATYQFNRLLGLGISIGYDSYETGGFHDLIPIQVVVSGYISPTPVSLFYSLGTGYGISISEKLNSDWIEEKNKGGFLIYPKLGVRLSGHAGINTTLFTGIKIQKSTLERRWGENLEESTIQKTNRNTNDLWMRRK